MDTLTIVPRVVCTGKAEASKVMPVQNAKPGNPGEASIEAETGQTVTENAKTKMAVPMTATKSARSPMVKAI
jgi:hypothetical protein